MSTLRHRYVERTGLKEKLVEPKNVRANDYPTSVTRAQDGMLVYRVTYAIAPSIK